MSDPVLLPVRGGVQTLVDADVGARFAGVPQRLSKDGNVMYSGRAPTGAFRPILLHRRVLQMDGVSRPFVDHINGNKLDNRAENLRPVSVLHNAWNTPGWRKNTSGFKGVTWSSAHNRYMVRIMCAGKNTFVGYFTDPVEAAMAYDAKARELRGDETALNFGGGVRGVPVANPQRRGEGGGTPDHGWGATGALRAHAPWRRDLDAPPRPVRNKATMPNVHLTGAAVRPMAPDAGRIKVRPCRQCGEPVESPINGGRPREVHSECKEAYTIARNRAYNERREKKVKRALNKTAAPAYNTDVPY